MDEKFCAVCFHTSPGHEPLCPVLTGAFVRGVSAEYVPGHGPVPFAGLPEDQQPKGITPGYMPGNSEQILIALQHINAELFLIRELLEKELPRMG